MAEDKKLLTDVSQVPKNMTDEEEAEFWATHKMTEEFLLQAVVDEDENDEDLPPKRTEAKTVTIRMDLDTIERLQKLAEIRHKGYQTLLKQFVIERLYEEEKRSGVI
ncbi:BrnA antitoxin family protein [Fodinisporobacter ferrooxydans]|uniref:BrnA antitoxin family protein n=1 Tax=Fodinisporobacter ferrooxydans TaxID=2901836 RepID=A0ABY4CEW3_9BACL|nr:BrnA antitoxin family protein [Alicyclobacillaceae bacterium MYW30-H2]